MHCTKLGSTAVARVVNSEAKKKKKKKKKPGLASHKRRRSVQKNSEAKKCTAIAEPVSTLQDNVDYPR